MEGVADLRPCDRCGYTHPRRMIALMSLWFGRWADLPADSGYFYLCPRCYGRLIEPHAEEIIQRLVEQHPFLHSRTPVRHYQAEALGEQGIRRPPGLPGSVREGGAETSPGGMAAGPAQPLRVEPPLAS